MFGPAARIAAAIRTVVASAFPVIDECPVDGALPSAG
jgi:hypothetical protein